MGRALIYGLIDPRTRLVRYVGQSSTGLTRPKSHGQPAVLERNTGHSGNWIRELRASGLGYEIVVLEWCAAVAELDIRESWWIDYARASGWPLTNLKPGGASARGHKESAETRRRKSEALRGRSFSEVTRQKMRESARSRWASVTERQAASRRTLDAFTDEERARLAAVGHAAAESVVVRKALSEKMRARWLDPELRARMIAGRSARIVGDRNPAKRPDVRAKLRAAASTREARRRSASI